MSESEKRKRRCCFTGHRPEKLTWSENHVKLWLERELQHTIEEGFVTFISGMSRGVDIWAAEIVLRLRDSGQPIHLICASPFEGFERNWSDDWRRRYTDIQTQADLVKYICPEYSRACFQARNEWMVNHSAKLIAVFNGEGGGTLNTILYARRQQIPIAMIPEQFRIDE